MVFDRGMVSSALDYRGFVKRIGCRKGAGASVSFSALVTTRRSAYRQNTAMTQTPRRTPDQSAQAFLTPRKLDRPLPLFMPDARVLVADGPVGKVVGRMQGDGPCVVLLHGWEGAASDFSGFVPPLLVAGFSVLALDLPAHGASEGDLVSIPLAAEALLVVQDALGPQHSFHAGIGHSLGAAILIHAMTQGCRVARAALIAAPAHTLDYARDYCERDGLDAEQAEQMLDHLHSSFGVDVRAISLSTQAVQLTQPALLVHSDDDRVVHEFGFCERNALVTTVLHPPKLKHLRLSRA